MRNFLRIYKILLYLLHLKPVFERQPTKCLNDDLPVSEVVGGVDGLQVARGPAVAAPHPGPGPPAGVKPGAGAQTPGTHPAIRPSHH